MENKRKKGTFLYLFRISLRRGAFWSCLVIGTGMALGISSGAGTLITQRLFDVAEAVLLGREKISALLGMLILLGGMNLLNQLVNCIGNISHSVYQGKMYGIFCRMLQERTSKLGLIAYEDTKQLDRMEQAKRGMELAALSMLIILLFLGFYIPWGLFMLLYLFSLSPCLALILPLAFLPTLLVQFLRTRTTGELEEKQAPARRENDYYKKCIAEQKYFRETRSMGAFGYFMEKHRQTLSELVSLERKTERRIALREAGFKCITAVGYIGAVVLLLFFLLKGDITVGAFAAVLASMNSVFSIMEEIVFYNMSQLQSNLGAVRNFVEFICDVVPEEGEEHPEAGRIEAKSISFTYPNAHREALRELSLCIEPGQVIALVGENGSGKSTLVKLLTGQYLPSKGTVLHNGIPTGRYKRTQLSNGVSGVFQQFQRYRLTLMENVIISQTDKADHENRVDPLTDEESIRRILDKVGFDGQDPGIGPDCLLSREFGGVDLSGGEWQRLAMARGIYRNHSFIVLDEPVAAIDPLREAEIYKMFADIAKGKTVIIVTHRLSSVQFADRIVVLKSGSIAETGTHKELLEHNGVYAEMFAAQREWYTFGLVNPHGI